MKNEFLSLNLKLKKYSQEHLLKYFNELSQEEKEHLINQIEKIDFDLVSKLYESIQKEQESFDISSIASFESSSDYIEEGLKSTKNGEYALVTMAGGQGTRLGYNGPKGTYILEYGINKSLFEIQCDKLKNLYNKTNYYVEWLIMTSKSNNDDTIKFFDNNNYFDYPKNKITFFTQDELPMIDKNGKIIMDSKWNIVTGANGHGGVISSLHKNELIKILKNKGIKWIFIGGIDNILLPIDNPDLVGFAIKNNYLVASKIVKKAYPNEKVGIFCKKNGKPYVIEYIEMTEEQNNMLNENGDLLYSDSHILCNLFNIDFLSSISDVDLRYIGAHKKANYIDEFGNLIIPKEENVYKFECFIFDIFLLLDDIGLLIGKREDIFAPIKNAEGVDSPKTASELYLKFHSRNRDNNGSII